MKLEMQVANLELSKRLKELGVKQESLYWWVKGSHQYGYEGERYFKVDDGFVLSDWKPDSDMDYTGFPEPYEDAEALAKIEMEQIYSAFTVSELGEILGCKVENISRYSKGWEIKAFSLDGGVATIHGSFSTEADARAKMLIYLIENGLLKPQEKEK